MSAKRNHQREAFERMLEGKGFTAGQLARLSIDAFLLSECLKEKDLQRDS